MEPMKTPGKWQLCVDNFALNDPTKLYRYPISLLQDFAASLCGKTIISKLDIVRAYHQIPLHPANHPKTTVITSFALFKFIRMSFGLRNALQTFERLTNGILQGFEFEFADLNDIFIASSSIDEHMIHLTQLFERFSEIGIIVNAEKHVLGACQVEFL